MAGGIDWFRWHHGSVTDPKFQLVARKSGARLSDVLAVWAFLLEKASASEQRGSFGDIDAESIDCLFGFDDGMTTLVISQMVERGLVEGDAVSAWEKRQPKREREGDNSTERSRAFREKQRHATPCNANEAQETPRGEERRVEKSSSVAKATGDKSPAEQSKTELWKAAVSLLSGQGMPEPQARSFVGKLSKDYPDGDIVLDAVRATVTEQPADARAYLKATCQQMAGERSPARPTFAQQAADIARTTVPAKPGRDPVLLEIERHSAKAAPIPESIREKLQTLKGGVLQ